MKTFKIIHLFPDLLNLYGDRGNIACIEKRLEWRNIPYETKKIMIDDEVDLSDADFILLGGGSDREQMIVCEKLRSIKDQVKEYIENDGVFLAVCGGYQLLGESYICGEDVIEGLGLVNIKTVRGDTRCIGNVVIDADYCNAKIVGFENHGGRTIIEGVQPFGKVVVGFGNDGNGEYEGIVYKNTVGTYIHGPLLPKNPELSDKLIENAIRRYEPDFHLSPLNDEEELEAKNIMIKRLIK